MHYFTPGVISVMLFWDRTMFLATVCACILVAASLMECTIALEFNHILENHDQDPSFDNIVEQKYPLLESLEPSFVTAHRRNLALNDSPDDSVQTCDPKCWQHKNEWLSCDDLVCIVH